MPRVTTIFCLALVLLSTGVHAQIAPEPNQTRALATPETDPEVIAEWIEQLDDDDWLVRDLATLELGELDPGISLEALESALRRGDLSAEQQARLRLACLRRFSQVTKGALGVSFGTIRVGAIEVQPIPADEDFPASMILKDGDQIAMIGDRVVDGSFSLRVEILSREPGDTLPVTVLRGDRVLHFEIPLGSLDDLAGAVRMDSELLSYALALRWQRLGLTARGTGTIGQGLSFDDWRNAAFPNDTPADARKPDLHAPRGWVLGPDMPTDIGNGQWTRTSIDVWADQGVLRSSATQRANLLETERVQPLVGLRVLIERERVRVMSELDAAEDEDEKNELLDRLQALSLRLETLEREIVRARGDATNP